MHLITSSVNVCCLWRASCFYLWFSTVSCRCCVTLTVICGNVLRYR
jgi:hypothetical protein